MLHRFLTKRPSPALAVAFLALLVALSGTAIALPGKKRVKSDDLATGSVGKRAIARNGVGRAEAANNSVGSGEVVNNGLGGTDINEGSLGTVPNANQLGGVAASGYVKATNFAYGEIDPTGAVKPSPPNRNIVSATNPLTGVYCVDLSFAPTFGSGNGTGASGVGVTANVDIPATNCPAGTEATVYVADAAGTFINDDFTVLFGGF
jgi:hypothetical protein